MPADQFRRTINYARQPGIIGGHQVTPRYSIIPGRFAEDARADVAHFRVINCIGRHTGNDGWCRLKQVKIGDAIGLTRETVNRKLRDLVDWGYVERRAVGASGRSIFYRTIMDAGEPPSEAADNDDDCDAMSVAHGSEQIHVSDGSHVGYNHRAELHSTCDRSDHTCCDPSDHSRCDLQGSHPYNDLPKRSSLTTSPHPPASGGRGRKKDIDLERVISAVRAERSDPHRQIAVDALLAPLVRQRKLDAPSCEGSLRSLADWISAKQLTATEAQQALDALLEARRSSVKPADITDAVRARIGLRPGAPELSGDQDLMARWPDVLAGIERAVGADKAAAWFSTVVIERVTASGVVHLATHERFIAHHIAREFDAVLRAVCNSVFGGVSSVQINPKAKAA